MHQSHLLSIFNTPFGMLKISHDERFIYNSIFIESTDKTIAVQTNTELVQQIHQELSAYFADAQYRFQLPIKPQGSPYQLKVYEALLKIPAGHPLTYGELSHTLQSAPRAIGQACKRNPIALFIPCHRVVGKNDIGGFMGSPTALHFKSALLNHEKTAI